MKLLKIDSANRNVECVTNTPVANGLLSANIEIPMACGGNGACATCHVHVVGGEEFISPISAKEERALARLANRSPKSRLACQALIRGPVSVRLPQGEYVSTEIDYEKLIGKRAERDLLSPSDGSVLVGRGQIITRYVVAKLTAAARLPQNGTAK